MTYVDINVPTVKRSKFSELCTRLKLLRTEYPNSCIYEDIHVYYDGNENYGNIRVEFTCPENYSEALELLQKTGVVK